MAISSGDESEDGRRVPFDTPQHVPIPGERDPTTLTHREPGAMGGRLTGEDVPSPDPSVVLDEKTAREHRREGGKLD
jgi:hypothetical protein